MLLGSEFLEIAIGLGFVYFQLSLVCSTLAELIARFLALRSRTLKQGIYNLLSDPKVADEFFTHPLIAGLYRPGFFDRVLRRAGLPSYIPSRSFALALLDVVMPANHESGSKSVAELRKTILKLPSGELRRALLPLIDSAEDNLGSVRTNVEAWFDDAMDRVAGWYKREAQLIILGLALAVSFTLNADSFAIANSLSQNARVRAIVVASAEHRMDISTDQESETPLTRILDVHAELQQMPLPIGWHATIPSLASANMFGLENLLGLIFTSLAVSLGAPFWFELLNKLVNIRASGSNPSLTSE